MLQAKLIGMINGDMNVSPTVALLITLFLTFENTTLVELVLVEMSFSQVGISSSCLLVELSFGRLIIWSSWYLVKLSFGLV
jgi:hypothetical protein